MTTPAIDLVLRMARAAAGARRCPECGRSLRSGGVEVHDHASDHIVLDVTCPACGHVTKLDIRPDAGAGVATVG